MIPQYILDRYGVEFKDNIDATGKDEILVIQHGAVVNTITKSEIPDLDVKVSLFGRSFMDSTPVMSKEDSQKVAQALRDLNCNRSIRKL